MKNRLSRVFLVLIGAAWLLAGSSANADTVMVSQPTDFWFSFDEPSVFSVRTYAVDGAWSDPMLWFYDATGVLITANDDWYGLQSNISVQVQPGSYRLRAGVCCGNPDNWWSGVQYQVESAQVLVTTSSEFSTTSTRPTEPPTTTSEPPTTTTTSSSTTTTTSTLPPTTTTELLVPPTTVVQETTTTATPEIPTTTGSSTSSTSTTTSSTSSTTTVAQTTTVVTTTTIPETTTTTVVSQVPTVQELGAVDKEQAAQIFAALDVGSLSKEEAAALVAAVQDAPMEVRQAFEQEVDIFSGATDTYVPLGSTVPVSTRRTLIVVTTVAMVAAVTSRRKW